MAAALSEDAAEDSDTETSDRRASGRLAGPSGKRKPVWEDPDGDALAVNIATISRLRKLRQAETDTVVTGSKLHVRQLLLRRGSRGSRLPLMMVVSKQLSEECCQSARLTGFARGQAGSTANACSSSTQSCIPGRHGRRWRRRRWRRLAQSAGKEATQTRMTKSEHVTALLT